MIERIRVIGVGPGDPGQVTGEAVRALGTVDVFLVPHPRGEPDAGRDDPAYDRGTVDTCTRVIDGLAAGETTVGFLGWGDPAHDEATIRVVDALVERYAAGGVALDHDVIDEVGRMRPTTGRSCATSTTTRSRCAGTSRDGD